MNRLAVLAGLLLIAAIMFGHNIVDIVVDRTPWIIPVAFALVAVTYVRQLLRMIGQ